MKKFKEENLKEIINYQMKLNGYAEKYEDLQKIENWFFKFTTTNKKEKQFYKWLKDYLKPFIPNARINNEADYFILNYGLRNVEI